MPITIVKGSQEYIKVTVIDNSDTPITDLSTLSPTYDTSETDFTPVEGSQAATASGMILYCLVDGTDIGYVSNTKYYLFVEFTAAPESPRLGPIEFFIV